MRMHAHAQYCFLCEHRELVIDDVLAVCTCRLHACTYQATTQLPFNKNIVTTVVSTKLHILLLLMANSLLSVTVMLCKTSKNSNIRIPFPSPHSAVPLS